MSDPIDREALLRQIDIDSEGEPGYYGDTWKFIDTIKRLPSALGTNLAEVGTDCISRQQAIDAVDVYMKRLCRYIGTSDDTRAYAFARGLLVGIKTDIGELPSAQPTFDARDTQYNLPIGTDCISRQQAIDDIWTVSPLARLDRKWVDRWLRQLPSAQPEIIRCKDCKHWIPYDWMFSEVWRSKNMADYLEDEMGCNCSDMAMKANDFCSRAERRTE